MFRMDTGTVATAAADIDRVKTKFSNIESSVSGYDVIAIEIEDGIDITGLFNKAKQKILNNVTIARSRVNVTSKQLNQISIAHEELQKMLESGEVGGINSDGEKIDFPSFTTIPDAPSDTGAETPSDDTPSGDIFTQTAAAPLGDVFTKTDSAPKQKDDVVEQADQTKDEITFTTGPSPYVAVEKADAEFEDAKSSNPSNISDYLNKDKSNDDSDKSDKESSKSDDVIKENKQSNNDSNKSDGKSSDVKNDDNDSNTATGDDSDNETKGSTLPSTVGSIIVPSVSDKSLGEVLSNPAITYDETGYALLENRFIVSCNKRFGKVGDIIQIKAKNGEVFECVIGNVTKNDGFNMYVNNKYAFSSENIDSKLNGNFDSIRNVTNISNVEAVNELYEID